MKRHMIAAFFVLGVCASLSAQQPSVLAFSPASLSAVPVVENHFNFTLVPALALPSSSANVSAAPPSTPALPDAPAPPSFGSSSYDGYRWDLGVGYEYVHFKAAPISLNLSGLNTDLTYNLNSWFGLEGNVISAFGGHVYSGTSTFVLYTGGGHIGWGPSRRRLTPWAHALVGGAHVNPQTAAGNRNGFAIQAGGGADWRFNERLSFRAQGDYIRTMLYSSSQNNFQLGIGAVIHF